MDTRGVTFRSPTAEDIEFVVEHMREADRRELKRWTGCDSRWGLENSVKQSEVCFSGVFADGKVACIFGATRINLLEDNAVIWSLSTDEVDSHRLAFAAGSKAGVDLIFRSLPDVGEFSNWVDLDYKEAVKWLEWLGGDFSVNSVRPGRCGGRFGEFYILNPYYKREEI